MKHKILSVLLVTLLISTSINLVSSQNLEVKSTDDNTLLYLLNSESKRNVSLKTIKAPMGKLYSNIDETEDHSSRFIPLFATPLCCYYEGETKNNAPLLIEDGKNPSKPVARFIEQYASDDIYEISQGDVEAISEDIAASFWNKSDIILAIENSDRGYEQGLMATPIASYLNIPVVIGPPSNDLISKLDCSYVMLIGENIEPPSDVSYIRLFGREAILSYVLNVCKIKTNKIDYITLANPLDSKPIKIINETQLLYVEGTDYAETLGRVHQTKPQSLFSFDVPDANQIVKFSLKFSPTEEMIMPEDTITPNGEGFHLLFYDQEGGEFNTTPLYNNGSLFYTDSNAYGDWEAYYEMDVNFNPGTYYVKLWTYGNLDKNWNLTITSQEINADIRPQAPYLSTLAPYLAASHGGIVIADEKFCENIAGKTGNIQRRYNVTLNEESVKAACKDNKYADSILDETLNKMKNEDLYDNYISNSPYLGVLADNNMIPMYYYPSETARQHYKFEGAYQPSDNLLADINEDGYNLTTKLELAVGRLMGWDAQDVSALIARTLFYNDIIDSFEGLKESDWKDSATMVYGLAMQERLVLGSRFTFMKTNLLLRKEGYEVFSKTNKFYKVKYIEELLENMEKSNLIWNEGHGRYYRYEYFFPPRLSRFYNVFIKLFYPQTQKSQYTVSNVKDMEMGPSAMAVVACIGGLTDGIPLRCTNAMASLHAGCNAIFANTRCPPGPMSNVGGILSAITNRESHFYYDELVGSWFEELTKNDASVGIACRNAKNTFTQKYTNLAWWDLLVQINPNEYYRACEDYVHYNIYGDPAFNPS